LSLAKVYDYKNIQEEKLNLLYVGQLEEHKGIRFLIESLSESEFNWQLNVIGTGSIKKDLVAIGKGNVQFHGQVDNTEIGKYLSSTDVLVMPTLCYENSPTVISEAHHNNCLVLASDIGGIPDLVKDGANGILFTPRDVDAMAEAIIKLLLDRELRRKMGNEGKKLAYPAYDASVMVRKIEGLYKDLLKEKRTSTFSS